MPTRDTSRKRDSILDAALEAFQNEGFDNASMDRIAEIAGASKRTVYNHFATKEDLINQIYLELKRESFGKIIDNRPLNADLRANLGHAWRCFVNWALENPVRFRLLEQLKISELVSTETKTELAKEFALFHDMMATAQKNDEIIGLPLDYHFQIMGALINATIAFLAGPEARDLDRAALIEEGFAIYWRGVSRSA